MHKIFVIYVQVYLGLIPSFVHCHLTRNPAVEKKGLWQLEKCYFSWYVPWLQRSVRYQPKRCTFSWGGTSIKTTSKIWVFWVFWLTLP